MDILSYCLISAAVIGSASQETPSFHIESTKIEVLHAQGVPTRLSRMENLGEEIWWYGASIVSFRNGLVHGWMNLGNNLNLDKPKDTSVFVNKGQFPVAFGDTKEAVNRIVGPPIYYKIFEALDEEIWFYGASSITFKKGHVVEWSDYGPNSQKKRMNYREEVSEELAADGDPKTDELKTMFKRIDPESARRFQGLFRTDGNPHTEEHIENQEDTILGTLDHLNLGPRLETEALIKSATMEEFRFNLIGPVQSATAEVRPATDTPSLRD